MPLVTSMGKNKKKNEKVISPQAEPTLEAAASVSADPAFDAVVSEAVPVADLRPAPDSSATAADQAPVAALPLAAPARQSLLRRLLPDLLKFAVALAVVLVAAAIWYKPPLFLSTHPYVTYTFGGQIATDAKLYRPLAMPTRYYIELPRQLANRYTWFAVDRRREVAALSEEPRHSFLGQKAIKRSDPLGLDLEFRKLDHAEWQVYFFDDSVVFSNDVLTVRLDTKPDNNNGSK